VQIFTAEGKYLEQTHQLGNLSKGFDGYATTVNQGLGSSHGGFGRHHHGHHGTLSQGGYGVQGSELFDESDRLFSLSSSTFKRSLQTVKELERSVNDSANFTQVESMAQSAVNTTTAASSSTKRSHSRKKSNKKRSTSHRAVAAIAMNGSYNESSSATSASSSASDIDDGTDASDGDFSATTSTSRPIGSATPRLRLSFSASSAAANEIVDS
jgi:hypothetical protein